MNIKHIYVGWNRYPYKLFSNPGQNWYVPFVSPGQNYKHYSILFIAMLIFGMDIRCIQPLYKI